MRTILRSRGWAVWGSRILGASVAILAFAPVSAQEFPVTIQGRLTHEGRPVEGLHDFFFILRGAQADGTDRGILMETLQPAVPVRDGLFNVTLVYLPPFFDIWTDPAFSAAPERAQERWLEVAVRRTVGDTSLATVGPHARRSPGSPPPGFTSLGPAIPLAVTPMAAHAAVAASLTAGAVTPPALALPPGASGPVSVVGGKFTVGPPAWLLSGNAGTGPTHFLGTTDNQPLEVRVANQRALRIEPRAAGPNLIGGHAANAVVGAAGVVIAGGGTAAEPNMAEANHAVIGGGLSNRVAGVAAVVAGGYGNSATNQYASVGGGWRNSAREAATTIAGGAENLADGAFATIGGGRTNLTKGPATTIAGGDANRALVDGATVGGGQNNEAFGEGTTVSGGGSNRARLDYATVSGGTENWAQSFGATVGGGAGNWAHAVNATVAGGGANQALGAYSSIPGGTQAQTWQHGQMAQSAGNFSGLGDAQTSVYVLRGETTPGGGAAELSLDNQGALLQVGPDQTVTFDILVVGRSQGLPPNFQVSGGYAARGVIKRVGGASAAFVGTPTVVELGVDDPSWRVSLAPGSQHLRVVVSSGATPDTVRWVARVQTAETMWGSFFPPTP
ncbi:MAG: hypothetical protein IPM17_09165 [Verrucomicrobia bacterium]|nr:hypothetical protein [Verrucomicrobiota bacterium]